jgi:uncharacterized protein YdeI (YjbR/CyaY-like superfamily)
MHEGTRRIQVLALKLCQPSTADLWDATERFARSDSTWGVGYRGGMARPTKRSVKPATRSTARARPAAAARTAASRVAANPERAAVATARRPAKSAGILERGFADRAAWWTWLAAHHATSPGIAMRIGRKGGARSISYAEALEVALAWGWIDGQKAAGDATAWLQRFAPRKPRSIWSRINRAKALELIARGEIQPAGLAAIERAKASGRWDAAYDSPSAAAVPDDLAAALAAAPRAQALFAELDAANRYAILHRTQTARQPETRARRIATLVAMLERGETLHPRRRSRRSATR